MRALALQKFGGFGSPADKDIPAPQPKRRTPLSKNVWHQ